LIIASNNLEKVKYANTTLKSSAMNEYVSDPAISPAEKSIKPEFLLKKYLE